LVITFVWPSQMTNLSLLAEFFRTRISTELNGLRGELNLAPVGDWAAWLRQCPALYLALWPEWFAPAEAAGPSTIVQAGFLVDPATAPGLAPEVESFLAGSQPPVLITGGTGNFVQPDFYTASTEGVRRLGRRGILVTHYPDYVPASLPGKMLWLNYLPYGAALPRMGAIIHHGGIGTCAQALAAGIPQLILAIGADRPDNAQRLQHLGVAEFLPPPRWQPEAVQAALSRLLGSAEVKQRAQALSEQIRLTDSLSVACAAIEKFSKEEWAWPAPENHSFVSYPTAKPPTEIRAELRQQLADLSPEKLELLARWAEANPPEGKP